MNLLESIGNTPIVEVRGFDTGPCQLFLKLENKNPGASIKDRVALSMIDDAERRGVLYPGGHLVEATAGNTGLGLALVAAQRNYQVTLIVPDKMSREKINHLRALGATVKLTRSDVGAGHPDYYQDKARAFAVSSGAWYVDQFTNPANPLAHERTTGPEIWQQMEGRVDAVVVGVGSGGTLGGLTQYFRKHAPNIAMVIADPAGSVIAPYVHTGRLPRECGSWCVEGIGEDFVPLNADFSLVRAAYAIPDRESFLSARELLRTNGILAGSSSGTMLAAALRYCREQRAAKRVLTFVCDDGSKYLSKMYSDLWMAEQGFLPRPQYGDLRDLITTQLSEGTLITVTPHENLKSAYARMKMGDLSQLPVIEQGKIVGILDEWDLLSAMNASAAALDHPCSEFMSKALQTIRPTEPLERVVGLLKSGLTTIIADENQFYGIVTKIDLVEYLRRNS